VRIPRQPPGFTGGQPKLTQRQAELAGQIRDIYLVEGFTDLTLDALAVRLRCSKMTLYTLAPSREQLATTILRDHFNAAGQEIADAVKGEAKPSDRFEVYIRVLIAKMLEMSPVCFHEVIAFEPTRVAYESFAREQADLLQLVWDDTDGGRSVLTGAFAAQLIRLTAESLCAGEFQADSGLSPSEAVDQLIALGRHATT
jgi:AcrR family transcriptional regulator